MATPQHDAPMIERLFFVLAAECVVVGLAIGVLDLPVNLVLVGAAVAAIFLVRRTRRVSARETMERSLREALTPLVGSSGGVRVNKWVKRSRRQVPLRVVLQFDAMAKDWDPKWVQQVVAIVESRTGSEYKIARHDSRARVIAFELDDSASQPEERTEKMVLEERAHTTMGELLGKEAKVSPHWQGDELASVTVRYPDETAVKLTSAMKRQHAERVVTAMLPGRWRAQWDVESSRVLFELRPPIPESVPHPYVPITDENRFKIPSGVTEDGHVTYWDLKSTVPHGLTIGKTGTGKTVQILGIVMEWALRGWAVWISDPKQIEFIGLKKWPNVQIVAVTVEEQMAMVVKAWNLMEQRYAEIVAGADEREFEPVLVMLDEYTDFISAVNHWWTENKPKGAPSKCPIFGMLGSLARKARSAKVHLLFGLQRPDAAFLGGEMRDNLGFRNSLGRLSPDGARMMWGAPYIGTSVPSKIPGRGMSMNSEGLPVESQSYWTPDPRRALRDRKEADLDILRSLLPREVKHKRLEFRIADEDDPMWIDDAGKSVYNAWQAIVEATTRVARDADDLIDLEELPAEEVVPAEEAAPKKERHLHLVGASSTDQDSGNDGYGHSTEIAADALRVGDLVNLDGVWVVVESAVADYEDEGVVSLSWRSDDDDAGDLTIDAEEYIEIRRPIESEELVGADA